MRRTCSPPTATTTTRRIATTRSGPLREDRETSSSPGAHPRRDLFGADRADLVERLKPSHARPEAIDVLLFQTHDHGIPTALQHEPEKGHSLGRSMEAALSRVKAQPQRVASSLDSRPRVAQSLGIVVKHEQVVAIANERAQAEVRGNQMVDWGEEQVGPDLGGQVANGQSVPALAGREQLVTREIEARRLDMSGSLDNTRRGRAPGSGCVFAQHREQQRMIDRGKELRHVEAQYPGPAACQVRSAPEAAMGPVAAAAGVRLRGEGAFDRR